MDTSNFVVGWHSSCTSQLIWKCWSERLTWFMYSVWYFTQSFPMKYSRTFQIPSTIITQKHGSPEKIKFIFCYICRLFNSKSHSTNETTSERFGLWQSTPLLIEKNVSDWTFMVALFTTRITLLHWIHSSIYPSQTSHSDNLDWSDLLWCPLCRCSEHVHLRHCTDWMSLKS